jgi:hypothetical protein
MEAGSRRARIGIPAEREEGENPREVSSCTITAMWRAASTRLIKAPPGTRALRTAMGTRQRAAGRREELAKRRTEEAATLGGDCLHMSQRNSSKRMSPKSAPAISAIKATL